MHTRRSPLLLAALSVVIALVALALLPLPLQQTAHADLSCEQPGPPLDDAELLAVLQDFYTAPDGTQFWTTDFCQFADGVWDLLAHGGPPPDGIPPIDDPQYDTLDQAAEWLQPQSPVIAISVEGEARAYPLAILTRHEIANDELGGVPVAVTFCPLCNSAIIFDRRVGDETLRFGVSGFLRNSDLIMWDDVTQSWWQQFTGEGIVGSYTGTQLDILPSQVVGFGAFADQFPEGTVLSRTGAGYNPVAYGTNPYEGYDDGDPYGRFFNPFLLDDRLRSTDRVLAGLVRGVPVAYPFGLLAEEGVINDVVGAESGDVPVVAFWQAGATSALDAASIDESEDVGMAALFNRELDDLVLTFTLDEDGTIHDDQTGSAWNIFGTATGGDLAGSQLRQENAFPHFWFAWAAFQPDTALYGDIE